MSQVNKVLHNRALTMELIRGGTAYRIRGLPQVLQDLIAEYNVVDHRLLMFSVHRQMIQIMYHAPRMNPVFQELKQTIERYGADWCDGCTNYVDNYQYTHQLFNDTLVYCSAWCMQDSVYSIRKNVRYNIIKY